MSKDILSKVAAPLPRHTEKASAALPDTSKAECLFVPEKAISTEFQFNENYLMSRRPTRLSLELFARAKKSEMSSTAHTESAPPDGPSPSTKKPQLTAPFRTHDDEQTNIS